MFRRPLGRLSGLAFVLILACRAALAVDVAGTWVVDRAAFDISFDRMVERTLARMPEAQRAQMRTVFEQSSAAMKKEMSAGLAGALEFTPTGELVVRDAQNKDVARGVWQAEGQGIVIRFPTDPRMKDAVWHAMPNGPALDVTLEIGGADDQERRTSEMEIRLIRQ